MDKEQNIKIWGQSVPINLMNDFDREYMGRFNHEETPAVDQIWREMDLVWDELHLDNRAALQGQAIGNFYSHPVWVVNGVFSASDPVSIQHRDAIAAFVCRLGVERVADYGGGFGELALRLHAIAPKIQIDIVEPYPSSIGMLRVGDIAGIRFIKNFDGQYDCIIAQDVLEHVEQPLALTKQMIQSTRSGGYLIFANCFYPVIKCHLPSTFYLRHTFTWVVGAMGLEFIGRVDGANHALVFKKVGGVDSVRIIVFSLIAKLLGPLLNFSVPVFRAIGGRIRKRSK
jgi:2-polyprenyl-3-methyl-5-hydroxy-6-metoxy-1,4-benzoquinol methylase